MKRMFILTGIAAIAIIFNSCTSTTYSVQLLTGDSIVLADTYREQKKNDEGDIRERELPAIFRGPTLDKALVRAHDAGYTKILSIETYCDNFLGIIPIRQVVIRCSK